MVRYLYENKTGEETPFTTAFDYELKDSEIVFKFDCENSRLFSAYQGDNEPLYLGDVVEVFIGVGENPKKYYEIEVAPNGALFFAEIENNSGNLKTDFLEPNLKRKVRLNGSSYSVEISVPRSFFNLKDGDKIYFNAFRIETEGGTPEKNLIALSPTLHGRFHDPSKFILLE